MKKLRLFLAVSVGFLLCIGLLILLLSTASVAKQRMEKWSANYAGRGTLFNLGEAYTVLQAIRSGDTNEAIELLESRLDLEVVIASSLVDEQTNQKNRAAYVRLLKKVRDYRIAHPRKTGSAQLDQSVEEALSSIP